MLPQQLREWRLLLPLVPIVTAELRKLLRNGYERDGLKVIQLLAAVDSASAKILINLEVPRNVVAEAMSLLQGKRSAIV